MVVEADGVAFAGPGDDFEIEAPVFFVVVEMAPVGAEVDVGFEAGGEPVCGFDGAGGGFLYSGQTSSG